MASSIKFARFKNATLELFEAPIESTDYIAFSHVWGNWAWRSTDGIPYEIKASEEKAHFIANDLPALVGDGAFWMDTLTVNQRNPAEVSEIVDKIPTIFRMAKKTIAVRECDGLYDCCIAAVNGFESVTEFVKKFHAHDDEHFDYICAESYLQRLWTLQECLLSHTIEFVVGTNNQPKTPAVRAQTTDDVSVYRHRAERTILADALWVLAYSFSGSQGIPAMNDFFKAYVHGGTVINPRGAQRTQEEDIHTGSFLKVNRASHRSATMPRDYIFATMPSFPWYTYPSKEALTMSFGDIYLDLYQQAARSGHAFTCRFTRSMIDATCTDPVIGWLPSQHLPSPTTLGDFLKLVGQRVPENSNASSQHVHVTSVVHIEEFECDDSPDFVIALLEASLKNFQEQWEESHRGGELSKYGSYPSVHWTLDHLDAIRCGWLPTDPEHAIRVSEYNDQTLIRIGPGLEYEEDDLVPGLRSLDETEQEARTDETDNVASLFVQARKILDNMWCAHDPHHIDAAQKGDWASFKRQMQGLWSKPLLRTVFLLAAMVNCRVPLSAAAWVNKLFVPVYIHHGKFLLSAGLLAKHARQPKRQRQQPGSLLCVGQHLPSSDQKAFGKNLYLVDAKSKVPVGLVPDLIPDDQYPYWAGEPSKFRYLATISFLSWEDVQKRLELCFQDLNNGLFPPEDEQDDEDADCKQSKLDSGIAVFEALFRGSDHFADKDATTQYMSTSSQPPSRGDIRDSLLSLARQKYNDVSNVNPPYMLKRQMNFGRTLCASPTVIQLAVLQTLPMPGPLLNLYRSAVEDPSSVDKNELEQTEEVRRLNAQLKQCESELLSNVRSWNTQMLAPIKKGLEPIFDATINKLQNGIDQVEREISSAMKLLELNLRAQCPEPITVELDTSIRRITHKPIALRDMENVFTNGITAFMQEQNDRCCTDIFERSYFRNDMSKVYDKSYRTRPTPGQTVKLAQMEMFEQLLCDANTNPFKAVYTRLGEAIVSEKQRVKDLLEEHVGALFRSIEEEFERSREVRVALTNEEAQIMDDLLNSRVTAAKVRGILEEKLKECGVDVEAIKAEFTERQSL
ncbi:unnamed protein product [Alternaria alternata]